MVRGGARLRCSRVQVRMYHLHHAAAQRLVIIYRREVSIEEGHVQGGVGRGECEASSAAVFRLPARVVRVLEHSRLSASSLVQEESIPGACVRAWCVCMCVVRAAWCVVRGAWLWCVCIGVCACACADEAEGEAEAEAEAEAGAEAEG